VEALDPRAIVDVTLGSASDLLDLLGIHAEALAAACLQELKERNPIDARRFEGNGRDAACGSPVCQGFPVRRVRPQAAHGLRVVTRGHGDTMRFRPDGDARRMQISGSQLRREGGSGLRGFALAWRHNHLHNSPVRGAQWAREQRD
jgi:hypothetical protein